MIKSDSANVQRIVAENLVKLKAIIVSPKAPSVPTVHVEKVNVSTASCALLSGWRRRMETREQDRTAWWGTSNGNAQNCSYFSVCRRMPSFAVPSLGVTIGFPEIRVDREVIQESYG
jgi:hypothetical protein